MKLLSKACGKMNCPAVYQLPDGALLIVGKRAIAFEGSGGDMVGPDEHAIIISRTLVEIALKSESN